MPELEKTPLSASAIAGIWSTNDSRPVRLFVERSEGWCDFGGC